MTAACAATQARATLIAGTRFLRDRMDARAIWPGEGGDVVRHRYLGNCLGELDRFLHHYLDALAVTKAPPRRHAAVKLSALRRTDQADAADQRRLRAIGRSHACLRYCGGVVGRGDHGRGGWMTAGWTDRSTGHLRRYAIGDRLYPANDDIIDICAFYEELVSRIGGR